jgi:hypothetical protein
MSLLLKSILATTFLLLLTVTHSLAQGGGKAEPRRIEFTRGTNTTTINDKIRDDQEAEYVLAAKKGQRLKIKLTSVPSRSFGV